jgi:hypothetical protein
MSGYDRMRADYERIRDRANDSLRAEGRREMLWLMALGAACAEVIYAGLDQGDIHGCHDWYDRERTALNMHDLALEMLR